MHGKFELAFTLNPFAAIVLVSLLLLIAWRVVSLGYPQLPKPNIGSIVIHPVSKIFACTWLVWAYFRMLVVAIGGT